MGAFPQYSRHGFHFSSESYGGHYGPIFNEYIEEQNAKNISGAHKISLETVLIGYVDFVVHGGWLGRSNLLIGTDGMIPSFSTKHITTTRKYFRCTKYWPKLMTSEASPRETLTITLHSTRVSNHSSTTTYTEPETASTRSRIAQRGVSTLSAKQL